MKLLFDFFPIILFFLTYHQAGFLIDNTIVGDFIDPAQNQTVAATMIATVFAIIGSFIQVGYHWLKTRGFEKSHILSLVLISVLGGITIMFGNPAFIQWKPTLLNWVFAGAFLVSMFIGKENLVQKMMGSQIRLPDEIWPRLNLAWVGFFIFSGFANLYVAFYYNIEADEATRMDFWVNFKLIGLMGLTIVFMVLQLIYIMRHVIEDDEETQAENNET